MTRRSRANPPIVGRRSCRPSGFTLIEMLVVIVIIGGLLVLLLPGIQAARECARRFQCAHQLSQLIAAVHNYELAFDVYPPGTVEKKGPIQNHAFGYHHSWITQLLPFIELENEARMIDRRVGVYHKNNAEVRGLLLQSLCLSGGFGLETFKLCGELLATVLEQRTFGIETLTVPAHLRIVCTQFSVAGLQLLVLLVQLGQLEISIQ